MSLRHRFWLLTMLRWLPVGLVLPVVALLPLERGLSLAQLGAAIAVQGLVVLLLELPTGGLADTVGRRPVLVASTVVALTAYVVLALATTPLAFAVAYALMGAFRALDSGPLSAWFVDAVHAREPVGRRSEIVTQGLSRAGVVTGVSIAAGSLATGALLSWGPLEGASALAVPFWVAVALAGVKIVATVLLLTETPRSRPEAWWSPAATARTIGSAVVLVRRSRVLAALLAVELFWGFAMVAFETLMPVRLAELVGGSSAAGAIAGPVIAAGWAASAAGAAMVPLLVRRSSLVAVSVALKLVQAVTVVGMGLAWGPVGLVVGYVATYAVHSAADAAYEALLHEQVTGERRATVLSLASMVSQPSGALGALALGALATGASTSTAMVVGGLVLALAAPLFLVRPARVSARA